MADGTTNDAALAGMKTAAPAGSSVDSGACVPCHENHVRFRDYGAHSGTKCEDCHGPSSDHLAEINGKRGKMELRGNDSCLECHDLSGSSGKGPADDPFERHIAFIEKKHVIRVNREKTGMKCVYCHDPHLAQ